MAGEQEQQRRKKTRSQGYLTVTDDRQRSSLSFFLSLALALSLFQDRRLFVARPKSIPAFQPSISHTRGLDLRRYAAVGMDDKCTARPYPSIGLELAVVATDPSHPSTAPEAIPSYLDTTRFSSTSSNPRDPQPAMVSIRAVIQPSPATPDKAEAPAAAAGSGQANGGQMVYEKVDRALSIHRCR